MNDIRALPSTRHPVYPMVGKVLQGCGCHLLRGYVEHTIAYNFPRVLREPVDINHTRYYITCYLPAYSSLYTRVESPTVSRCAHHYFLPGIDPMVCLTPFYQVHLNTSPVRLFLGRLSDLMSVSLPRSGGTFPVFSKHVSEHSLGLPNILGYKLQPKICHVSVNIP